jgi:multiple sugar transport system substrate-binding protein
VKFPRWIIAILLVSIIAGCSKNTQSPSSEETKPDENLIPIKIIADGPNTVSLFKMEEKETEKKFGVRLVYHYPERITENMEDYLFSQTEEQYDIYIIYSAKLPLYVEKDMLIPIDNYITEDFTKDVLPIYRNIYMNYNEHDYGMAYDGGAHLLFYRKDLFEKYNDEYKQEYGKNLTAPTTWTEYDQIAKFLTRDTNDDGKTDIYGTALLSGDGMRYIWFLERFLSMGGSYFDEDMNPLIDNEIGIRALTDLVRLAKSDGVPPNAMYDWTDLNNAFLQGKVAMVVQWSDTGRFSMDTKTWDSKIAGKVGWTIVPGEAPGAPHGGTWLGRVITISKNTKYPDKVWDVIQYITSEKVSKRGITSFETGTDPYRQSHLTVESKRPFSSVEEHRSLQKAIADSYKNTNVDLIIPGSWDYMQSLDRNMGLALIGTLTPKEALQQTATEWEKITEQNGRESQKQFFQKWLQKIESVSQ